MCSVRLRTPRKNQVSRLTPPAVIALSMLSTGVIPMPPPIKTTGRFWVRSR